MSWRLFGSWKDVAVVLFQLPTFYNIGKEKRGVVERKSLVGKCGPWKDVAGVLFQWPTFYNRQGKEGSR